jgi:hypothetical protein
MRHYIRLTAVTRAGAANARDLGRPDHERMTSMNDPHVEVLYYKLEHGEHVDFSKAVPLTHEERDFSIHLANRCAQITMKTHFPSLQEARAAVEPFLRAWELDMGQSFIPRRYASTLAALMINACPVRGPDLRRVDGSVVRLSIDIVQNNAERATTVTSPSAAGGFLEVTEIPGQHE